MPYRFRKEHEQSAADLKDMMTALPMAIDVHAAINRKRVQTRRMLEDALEAARARKDLSELTWHADEVVRDRVSNVGNCS